MGQIMFGWNLAEILSFGVVAGFLIFLAIATRPSSTIAFKKGKKPSAKTSRRTHIIVLIALVLGFMCVLASVVFYAIQGK